MSAPHNRLCFDDFAAAQAGGAHADVLGGRADFGVNRTQIDVPASLAHVVRVTDGIAELRPLAADITNSCHDSRDPSQADAETIILQEGSEIRYGSRQLSAVSHQ